MKGAGGIKHGAYADSNSWRVYRVTFAARHDKVKERALVCFDVTIALAVEATWPQPGTLPLS
jgi:hypothetical protein